VVNSIAPSTRLTSVIGPPGVHADRRKTGPQRRGAGPRKSSARAQDVREQYRRPRCASRSGRMQHALQNRGQVLTRLTRWGEWEAAPSFFKELAALLPPV